MEIIKNKNGISYRTKYYNLNKQPRYQSFKKKTDARIWKQNMESAKRLNPDLLMAGENKMTFKELYLKWFHLKIKNKRASKTVYQYQTHYNKHFSKFDSIRLSQFSSENGEEFVNTLIEQGLKEKSVNNVLILLKQVFKYAHDQGFIRKNPLRSVALLTEQQKDISFLSQEEVQKVLNANLAEAEYPVLVFALNSGLRIGEVAGICWDCVNFQTKQILVKRSLGRKEGLKNHTKNHRIRYIPMNDTIFEVMESAYKNNKSELYVFTRQSGKPLDPDHYSSRHFKTALKRAGLGPTRFHDIRHTFASHFMMNGGNIYDLKKLLGHQKIETTEIYAHLSPEHLRSASQIINFKADKILDEPK